MLLGLYQHYRGNYYHVLGVCRHEETLEEMIVYRGLYADYGLWVRPRAVFESKVSHEGREVPRFKFIRALDMVAPVLELEV